MTIERASDNPFPSVLLVEGDPTALPANPASGQRRLAVGTDHLLYLVDPSGVKTAVGAGLSDPMTTRGDLLYRNASNVTARLGRGSAAQVLTSDGTDIAWAAAGGGGAATSEPFVTTAPTAGLSAETVHPELADFNASGATPISMAGASTGTGVTVTASANTEGFITFTQSSYQQWDVASSIGTGNFDIRARLLALSLGTLGSGVGGPIVYLAATDSSRTVATAACVNVLQGMSNTTGVTGFTMRTGIGQTQVNGNSLVGLPLPAVMRVKRVGTTVTTYVSPDNGRTWAILGSNTNAVNVAKVGLWFHANSATDGVVLVEWLRSF